MKTKPSASRLATAYHRGFAAAQKGDRKNDERNATIINHLAEGTYDRRLMTKAALVECLGAIVGDNMRLNNRFQALRSKIAMLLAESIELE